MRAEKSVGNAIASSSTFTAEPNADGNTSANLSAAESRELAFTVSTKGKVKIRFTNQSSGGGLHEFLLLACKVSVVKLAEEPSEPDTPTPTSEIIDLLGGIKVWSFDKTIYIQAAPDTEYKIIDVSGRILKTGITNSDREEVVISRGSGIAVVRIGGKSFKVRY